MDAHAPRTDASTGRVAESAAAPLAFEDDAQAGQRVLDAIQLWRTAWDIVEGTLRAEHPDWPADRIASAVRAHFRGA